MRPPIAMTTQNARTARAARLIGRYRCAVELLGNG